MQILITLLITACGVVAAEHITRQTGAQKPVITVPFHTDGGPSGRSLDELWGIADIVADATVSSDGEFVKSGSAVLTRYVLQLNEVYKSPADFQGGTTITVQMVGGDIDRGDHIERRVNKNFPPFVKGERYVLFLRSLPEGRYSPATAEAAFLIRDGALSPRGKGTFAREMNGRSAVELSKMLRAKKSGGAR